MVIPALLMFLLLILKCGEVTLAKTSANLEARRKVYTTPPAAEPDALPDRRFFAETLQVKSGTSGLAQSRAERRVNLRPVLKERDTFTGRVAVVTGTWDHRGIDFPRRTESNPISERGVKAAAVPPVAYDLAALYDQGRRLKNGDPSELLGELLTTIGEEALGMYFDQWKGTLDTVLDIIKDPLNAVKDLGKILSQLDDAKAAFSSAKNVLKWFDKLLNADRDRLRNHDYE